MLQRAVWDRKRLKRILSHAMGRDNSVLKSLCIPGVSFAVHQQPALQMRSVSRRLVHGVFRYNIRDLPMAALDHMLPELDVCEMTDFEDAVESFRTFRFNHVNLRKHWKKN